METHTRTHTNKQTNKKNTHTHTHTQTTCLAEIFGKLVAADGGQTAAQRGDGAKDLTVLLQFALEKEKERRRRRKKKKKKM